jgi:iron-sulfur cluster assembly accessory protein
MENTVNVTARAANRICEITAGKSDMRALRISVNGGGCSGFQYDFAIADARSDDDLAIEKDGATVLIDSVSLGFMSGSTVDFVDDLIGQSFKVQNPLAKASCGCGVSFTI